MTISLPVWVIKAVNKKHNVFLWMGMDSAHWGEGGSVGCPGRTSVVQKPTMGWGFLTSGWQDLPCVFAGSGFSAQGTPTGRGEASIKTRGCTTIENLENFTTTLYILVFFK
jgi:hypothetical protein